MEMHFDKDDVIKLHQMLYEAKKGLEEEGLDIDLSEYEDFGVYASRDRVSAECHWHAISLLAEALASEARRVLLQKT